AVVTAAGVPVVPAVDDLAAGAAGARAAAEQLGYPLLVKAAAGGGGKGMRVARDEKELSRLFTLARAESEAAFGSRTMYLEKYLEHARHVEFQIIADTHRNVIHMGERDCSIQRRHQKVLEEAPCPVMTARLREKMGKAAVRAAQVVGYSNVGTVEFLLASDGTFYFIEMNTRIQVEHGVTEMVTGVDLVRESLALAMGERLRFKQRQVSIAGAAMEFRIYAEDPDTHLPSPGVVSNHHPPGGLGVRVESALYDGYRVPVHYDPLIAKVIVHASDRPGVVMRARAALREYLIDGIKTNIPLHLRILQEPDFLRGEFATDFLGRFERDTHAAEAVRAAGR
ncbi:MAG TPA: ATP-grasp domain-containing protein, partial [Candidatus Binataceae bacterium]|nr:ATP-grasp domain-containing protein [Candidatus Binataceae bacterium]